MEPNERVRVKPVPTGLTVSQLVIGGWALLAPTRFFTAFPAAGRTWVALLPPYNEHLVRDVGALSLALAVVLARATVTADRPLIRVAAVAFAVYTVPHSLLGSEARAVGHHVSGPLPLPAGGRSPEPDTSGLGERHRRTYEPRGARR